MAPICLCHVSKCPRELVMAVTRIFFCPVSDLSIRDCSIQGFWIDGTLGEFSEISEISLLLSGVAPCAKEDNEEDSSKTIDNSTSLTRTLLGREN